MRDTEQILLPLDVTWVAAISSLYPVSTHLLTRIVLHERVPRLHTVDLVMAGIALTLHGY